MAMENITTARTAFRTCRLAGEKFSMTSSMPAVAGMIMPGLLVSRLPAPVLPARQSRPDTLGNTVTFASAQIPRRGSCHARP
jgi:hypothetical protein